MGETGADYTEWSKPERKTPIQYTNAQTPHSSTLDWKIPWTAEPGRLQSMGLLRGRTRLRDFTFTFHFHALDKETATHSSVLAWRIPGTKEPGGLPSMGLHRVRHDWSDLAAAAAAIVSHLQGSEMIAWLICSRAQFMKERARMANPGSSRLEPVLLTATWKSSNHHKRKILRANLEIILQILLVRVSDC